MKQGRLYLIPVPLFEGTALQILPSATINIAKNISHFIIESHKEARAFLRSISFEKKFDDCEFSLCNEHTKPEEFETFLLPLKNGNDVGLMSDAGMPCIADPGTALVLLAHKKNIEVVSLTGPSSIFLALAASGLNGQGFTFNGYLPIEKTKRISAIRELEKRSRETGKSQIFIETPYRNTNFLTDILSICQANTKLCIACNLHSEKEFIITKNISEWKKNQPDVHKKPCVFIIQN